MNKLLLAGTALVATGAAIAAVVHFYREPAMDESWRERADEYPYRQ